MSFTGNEIGKLLIELELITPEELATAQEEQLRSGERLTLVLERLGYVSFNQLKDTLELQFGVNFISLAKSPPDQAAADLISQEIKRQYQLIPTQCHQSQVTVAMVNPDDLLALDYLRVTLKTGHIKKLVCTQDDFEYCLDQLYGKAVPQKAAQESPGLQETALESPVLETASASEAEAQAATNLEATATQTTSAYSPGKLPGKKHLQSLFGDDDDDDDLESLMRKPAAQVSAPAEPPASSSTQTPTTSSPSLAPAAEQVALKLESTSTPAPAPQPAAAPAIETTQAASTPVQQTTTTPTPTAPAPQPVAAPAVETTQAASTPVQQATTTPTPTAPAPQPAAAQAVEATQAASTAPENATTEPEIPALDLTVAEVVMETVLASVTSQLTELPVEDSQRQLLEEVIESEFADIEEMDLKHIQEAQSASVMLLAHEIIGKASQKKCSDIHLEPDTTGISLRYFLHGELLAACVLPLEIHQSLVSSYKIIAGLNPSEKNKPQDKKLKTKVDDDQIELRITTMPSENGEMVAISIKFSEAD